MWQNEEKNGESKPKFDCNRTGTFCFCARCLMNLLTVGAPSLSLSVSLTTTTEPALVHFLSKNTTFVPELQKTKSARVLVPGCGRGYALETFSSTFFDSENIVGLEVSETARNACEAYQSEHTSKAKCVVEDFFTHGVKNDDDKYDVIYDCTFLCAIQPTHRHVWAEQMRNLTKKGSRVISLVFPLGDFKGGPPFALSPELVKSLLQNDFDVEELIQVPEDMWARGRPEYLYIFIRK
jgi:methyl halide transferase